MVSVRGGWFSRTTRRCVAALRDFFSPMEDDGPPAPGAPEASTSPLAYWKTSELCREWRVTSGKLSRPLSAAELERLSELRRHCLDELQRRDPDAFARWLGDRHASADPTSFFGHPTRR